MVLCRKLLAVSSRGCTSPRGFLQICNLCASEVDAVSKTQLYGASLDFA